MNRNTGLFLAAVAVSAVLLAIAGAARSEALRQTVAQRAALDCARTTADFSDSGIVACFTDRGLSVPGDL